MAKTKFDLDALEKLCAGEIEVEVPDLRTLLAPNVDDAVEKVRKGIEKRDADPGTFPIKLVEFSTKSANNLDALVQYVAETTFDRVLVEYGVQDAYLSGEGVEETATGWKVQLSRPNSQGLFEVSVVEHRQPSHFSVQALGYLTQAA